MTTLALAAQDSATMTRRSLRHVLRYPVTLVMAVVVPVLLLLLFIGVFGGALKAGLTAVPHDAYIDFVVPGIIVLTAGYGCQATTMAVNRDSTEGIIARFRTMAISPASVLNGHVISALARTLLSVALVIGVSIGLGFRPTADAGRWLALRPPRACPASSSSFSCCRSSAARSCHRTRCQVRCAGSRRTSRSRRSSTRSGGC